MANVYATKTGNWSDPSVWNTGTLPATTDDVYANNFVVTLDQNITVHSLNNNGATGINGGGSYTVAAIASGTTQTLQVTNTITNSGVITVPAGMAGTFDMSSCHIQGTAISGQPIVTMNGTGVLKLGAVDGNANNQIGLKITAGTVNCGNVSSLTGGSTGVSMSAGTLNCGDITNVVSIGVYCNGGVINAGNVKGGSLNNGSYGIQLDGNGPTLTCLSAIANTGPAIMVTSNSGNNSAQITINGTVQASSSVNGVYVQGLTPGPQIRARGPLVHGANNYVPIWAAKFMVEANQVTQYEVYDDSAIPNTGALVVMSNQNTSTVPATTDVRQGVTFGGGGTLVGTLAVPPAASVASGVAVDNTTGTATLDLNQVSSVLGAQIAAALTS